MKIGLIIAIERELKSFISYGKDIKCEIVNNRTIYKTIINNNEIIAVMSGCGLIDAAAATQLLITKYDCELVLNFGVTGALDKSLKVEDLFVVRKVLNYGFDTSKVDNVKEHQYMDFIDEFIPLDSYYIEYVKGIDSSIKEAVVASGDKFIVDRNEKLSLNSLGCNICDMEIASIARVCYLNNVKCLSIKCISDTFDGDGKDFCENVTRSAAKAFDVILKLINKL